MKTGKPKYEMVRLLLGLVIVAAITITIITTLRVPAQGIAIVAASPSPTSSPQQLATSLQEPTTVVPYPVPIYPPTSPTVVGAAMTVNAIVTQKIAVRETFQAITPSPTLPIIYPPTGTSEDPRDIATGHLLGLNVLNGWNGILDGKAVGVYSGASSFDPEQGLIAIVINSAPFGNFPTPTKHGGVRVVSEQDNRLTLVSTDGTTYYFDVPAMSYVSSLTAFAPSITPPPTRTPFPLNYVTSTPYPGP
jgi:hypothetical protein